MTKVPELKGGQMLTLAYFIGILIILFVVYKVLGKVGLIKTSEKKKEEAAEENAVADLRTADVFNPKYYMDKKFKSLGENAITRYANELRSAMQGLGTDEEAIYATFGKIYNKTNISELAAGYLYKFGRDLQTDLLNELTSEEAVPLFKIINALPNN